MTAELEPDPLIEETVSRLCGDLCPPEVVNAAEDGVWPSDHFGVFAELATAKGEGS